MKTLSLNQGSPEWLAARRNYHCASEAPVMMGASRFITRTQLLEQKSSGVVPEVDAAKQRLFDRGHKTEALARAITEKDIGQELYPVTVVSDCGRFLASLDGITLDDSVIFEHKLASESLIAQVKDRKLEPHYYWQLEHELMVTGADMVIFACSDGTAENFHAMHYLAVPGRREALLAGWSQFEDDLATFVKTFEVVTPTGRAPETLPALHIEVTGMVTATNLDAFKTHALTVFGSINRSLQTDEDFANAKKAVKWCGDVEERLAGAKQHALSQTASIDKLFSTIDAISAEARTVRLDLDKLVKARDGALRIEIVTAGAAQLKAHIDKLNAQLGQAYMPAIESDFPGCIRGKKSFASMRDAVDTHLAMLKLSANETSGKILVNLNYLREHAQDYAMLFADAPQLVLKDCDACAAIVSNRITEHNAAVKRRVEAQRESIRQEELTRIEREKRANEAQTLAAAAPAPTPSPAPIAQRLASPAVFVPIQRTAAAKMSAPTLRLGQIGERLGFVVTADFLRSLGIEPALKERTSYLYHEESFDHICVALIQHIETAREAVLA